MKPNPIVVVRQKRCGTNKGSQSDIKPNCPSASCRCPSSTNRGRILEIYAKPGEAIGDQGTVDLGQTDRMEVIAEVYQTDIGKVRAGQSAAIASESFSGELHGTVRLIGLQVSQQKVFSNQPGENLDRRVVEVRIRLTPDDSNRVEGLTNLQVQVAIQQ